VFSATGQVTECTMTKMMVGVPRPHQISASGSSAIAGSGLNIEVRRPSASLPQRDNAATVVSTAAIATPSA